MFVLLHHQSIMKKLLFSFVFFALSMWGIVHAGTTPGQETGLMKRNLRRNAIQSTPIELAETPVAQQKPAVTFEAPTKVNLLENKTNVSASGSAFSGNASKNPVKLSSSKSGKGLGGFSLRNMWQAGKLFNSHKQTGFIQISITVFLFVVILLLIGMMLGVILNNLFILFYIALALLLLWVLIFMLGNLGLKRR